MSTRTITLLLRSSAAAQESFPLTGCLHALHLPWCPPYVLSSLAVGHLDAVKTSSDQKRNEIEEMCDQGRKLRLIAGSFVRRGKTEWLVKTTDLAYPAEKVLRRKERRHADTTWRHTLYTMAGRLKSQGGHRNGTVTSVIGETPLSARSGSVLLWVLNLAVFLNVAIKPLFLCSTVTINSFVYFLNLLIKL